MQSTEIGRGFLARVSEYLVTFPFDLKILQEAITEPDLERSARELAASVLISSLSPQEGSGPERFVDDVVLLRIALALSIVAATTTHFNPMVIWQDATRPRAEVPAAERARLMVRTNVWKQTASAAPARWAYAATERALGRLGLADNLTFVVRRG